MQVRKQQFELEAEVGRAGYVWVFKPCQGVLMIPRGLWETSGVLSLTEVNKDLRGDKGMKV